MLCRQPGEIIAAVIDKLVRFVDESPEPARARRVRGRRAAGKDIERARTEARALDERTIDESVATVTEAVRILTPAQRTRLVALWRAH